MLESASLVSPRNAPTVNLDEARQSGKGSNPVRIVKDSWSDPSLQGRLQLCLILSTPILQICFSNKYWSSNALLGTPRPCISIRAEMGFRGTP